MRRARFLVVFAVLLSTILSNAVADTSSPLIELQWLVGDWHAVAKSPDGTVTEIDNHISWSETHTAIVFVTRFNGQPQYFGMYAYDPSQRKIGFWYVDSEGQFTRGTATQNGRRVKQEFEIAKADGTTSSLFSLIERGEADRSYHWQVFRSGEDGGKPLIELDYVKK